MNVQYINETKGKSNMSIKTKNIAMLKAFFSLNNSAPQFSIYAQKIIYCSKCFILINKCFNSEQ